MTANPANLLYSTDYAQDKVIYLNSGSFTIPTPTAGSYHTIAHGLGFIPLVAGGWSTGSSFTTTYDFGSGTTPSSSPASWPFNVSLEIAADATNIYIIPANISGSSQLVYYRLYAFEPSTSAATIAATAASADSFVFNTDYNYTKLYSASALTGLSASSSNTVTHDIGTVPQVNAWATNTAKLFSVAGSVFLANVTYPIYETEFQAGAPVDVSVAVTSSTVVFRTGSASNTTRIDYRIYYDETGVQP